jgi:hypothetical protein
LDCYSALGEHDRIGRAIETSRKHCYPLRSG